MARSKTKLLKLKRDNLNAQADKLYAAAEKAMSKGDHAEAERLAAESVEASRKANRIKLRRKPRKSGMFG